MKIKIEQFGKERKKEIKNLEQQHAKEKRQKQDHEENEMEIEYQIVASGQKDRFYRREERSVN